jgi:hypothetical protein
MLVFLVAAALVVAAVQAALVVMAAQAAGLACLAKALMVLGERVVASAAAMPLAAPAVLVAKRALALPLGILVERPVLVAVELQMPKLERELLELFGRDALGLSHQPMLECHRKNK